MYFSCHIFSAVNAVSCYKRLLSLTAIITIILLLPAPLCAKEKNPSSPVETSPQQQKNEEEILADTYQQLEIFSNVLSIIEGHYVEEVEPAQIIKGAIEGLLQSLDPHSSYLSPEDFKDLQEETSGQFSGIGIEVTVQDNKLTIIAPIANTPAEKAHLKAGDIIVAIDGKPTREIGVYKAIEKLRGKRGTSVLLSILRKGWTTPREFTITRANIALHSVETKTLQSGLLYAKITSFKKSTSLELRKQLNLFAQKAPIEGVILDLRNNPGGLLEQAVDVVDIFLNQGVIVSTRGRQEDQNSIFSAHNNSKNTEYPLVILINEGSASAAEIVAGAIQAHRRGILVGTKSFGKGSVQTIIPLPDGAGIRITTAKYYTPDDISIQAVGITPDIIVPMQEESENDKEADTSSAQESTLPHHLPREKPVVQQVQNKELTKKLEADNQLKAAYSVLASLIFHTRQINTNRK